MQREREQRTVVVEDDDDEDEVADMTFVDHEQLFEEIRFFHHHSHVDDDDVFDLERKEVCVIPSEKKAPPF